MALNIEQMCPSSELVHTIYSLSTTSNDADEDILSAMADKYESGYGENDVTDNGEEETLGVHPKSSEHDDRDHADGYGGVPTPYTALPYSSPQAPERGTKPMIFKCKAARRASYSSTKLDRRRGTASGSAGPPPSHSATVTAMSLVGLEEPVDGRRRATGRLKEEKSPRDGKNARHCHASVDAKSYNVATKRRSPRRPLSKPVTVEHDGKIFA